jgi:hypothetical protein
MAATVRIKNVGPFARDIHPQPGRGEILASVECDAEVEVSAAVAASLLEQSDVWQPAEKKSDKGAQA